MTESKQVREKKKKNAQKVAEKAKTTKEVKETKVVKETEKVKTAEKTTKAEATSNSKVGKVEKVVEKATGQDENFNWKNGTMIEKCAFVGALFTLVGAIVCLIFEFATPAEDWPFVWFDIFIALSFIGQTFTHWRFNRKIAIFTGIAGAAFLIYGLLKLFGIIAL